LCAGARGDRSTLLQFVVLLLRCSFKIRDWIERSPRPRVLYFDEKLSIFVASNLDTAPTNRIQDDIAEIIFGESYQLPPVWRAVAVYHKIYDGYVGRYRKTDQPNFVITIKKENGQLWNRLGDDPGAAEMVVRPLSETRFFNKMFVLYEVTFVLGAEGRATRLVADGPWGRGEFLRIDQPSNAGEQK
jgi:hypothetical protein